MRLADLLLTLDAWFPPALTEDWDNVGLLLGDPNATITRIMTCLTVTPTVADEAIAQRSDLIVSHHPILFRGAKRLTADGPDGMIYRLAAGGVAVYSPHARHDNAATGINQQLADRLGLTDVCPLQPLPEDPTIGSGRLGQLQPPLTLLDLARRCQELLPGAFVQWSGSGDRSCKRVAVACGAAFSMVDWAKSADADVFITGEARFHDAFTADRLNLGLILVGHYASERFAVETLALRLQQTFPSTQVWASTHDTDPLQTLSS